MVRQAAFVEPDPHRGFEVRPGADGPVGRRTNLERQQQRSIGPGAGRSDSRRGSTHQLVIPAEVGGTVRQHRAGSEVGDDTFEALDQLQQGDRFERVVGEIEQRQRCAEMTRRLLRRGTSSHLDAFGTVGFEPSTQYGVTAHDDVHRGARTPRTPRSSHRHRARRRLRARRRRAEHASDPTRASITGRPPRAGPPCASTARKTRGDLVDVEVRLRRGARIRAEPRPEGRVVVSRQRAFCPTD